MVNWIWFSREAYFKNANVDLTCLVSGDSDDCFLPTNTALYELKKVDFLLEKNQGHIERAEKEMQAHRGAGNLLESIASVTVFIPADLDSIIQLREKNEWEYVQVLFSDG